MAKKKTVKTLAPPKATAPPKKKRVSRTGPAPVPPGKTPWADKVAASLAKREAAREQMKADALARGEQWQEDRTRKCNAWTTGNYGPRRPCDNVAMRGMTVCYTHGNKQVRAKAKQRLMEELDPTLSRLIELRDQDAHMPTALGAGKEILNRVLGKPDSVDKDKGAGRAIINVGISIGAIPKKALPPAQAALPEGTMDAEFHSSDVLRGPMNDEDADETSDDE